MNPEIAQLSFPEKCRFLLDIEAAIKKLAEKATEIAGSKRDLEAQETALRDAILAEMQADGVTNAEECGLVFAVQNKPRGVVVTDEAQIPEEYFKVSRTLDKKAVNAAAKEGKAIPGTALDNGGQTLTIRAKGRNT